MGKGTERGREVLLRAEGRPGLAGLTGARSRGRHPIRRDNRRRQHSPPESKRLRRRWPPSPTGLAMIDALPFGTLQIKAGSEFSEVRRTAAQSVQRKGVTLGRLAGCGRAFDLGGQRQRLTAKCVELRLHPRPLARPSLLLIRRDSPPAVLQSNPGEIGEARGMLPWGRWLGRGDHEEPHAPALAFAACARWLSPLNSRIVA